MGALEPVRAAIRTCPEIRTARMTLRPLRPGDVDALYRHFADWEILRWLARPSFPLTKAAGTGYFDEVMAAQATGDDAYLVIDCGSGPVGNVHWRACEASFLQSGAGSNLGYWLARSLWGRGLMSEAAGAVINHVFAATGENAIFSGVFDGNRPSLRIQEKLGFTVDGRAMVWSNPHRAELPHLNTSLTRRAWEKLTQ